MKIVTSRPCKTVNLLSEYYIELSNKRKKKKIMKEMKRLAGLK